MSFWDITGSMWLPKVNWRERPSIRTVQQWISAEDMNILSSSIVTIIEGVAPLFRSGSSAPASLYLSGSDGIYQITISSGSLSASRV